MGKRNWKIIKKRFFIERTNIDHSFTVVSRHDTYAEAIAVLKQIESPSRYELWSYDWVNTNFGFAPIAWIN